MQIIITKKTVARISVFVVAVFVGCGLWWLLFFKHIPAYSESEMREYTSRLPFSVYYPDASKYVVDKRTVSIESGLLSFRVILPKGGPVSVTEQKPLPQVAGYYLDGIKDAFDTDVGKGYVYEESDQIRGVLKASDGTVLLNGDIKDKKEIIDLIKSFRLIK